MAHSTETMRPTPQAGAGIQHAPRPMPVSSMNSSPFLGPGAVVMLPAHVLGRAILHEIAEVEVVDTGNIWLNWFPSGMYFAISSPKK